MNIACLMRIKNKIATPAKFITFDFETIRWTEPYACGMYDGKNCIIYEGKNCPKNFLAEFLTRKYRGYVAYAHNGGKFDFNFILEELCKKEYWSKYVIEPMRSGSRIIEIKISTTNPAGEKDHTWTLRDSYALMAFSLKKLTESFGVQSMKGEFDHEKINWNNWQKLKPEWSRYLINDCKGLYEVIKKFEEFSIKKFGTSLRRPVTIAQMAMEIFRKNYLENPIPNYESREEEIRKAYYGGRVEIFKRTGKNLKYYDVNSEYPSQMYDQYMPVGTPIKSYTMTVEDFGVAKCEVTAPEGIKYPLLPYRTEKGKLLFPKGSFKGWYCTPELKKAAELGYKIKIEYGYKFNKERIFKKYIKECYELKKKSKKGSVEYIIAKLLMNSLYGKFGQRREKEQLVFFPKDIIGLTPIDFFGEIPIYTRTIQSKANHILPAIAAFVTSYGRLKIYEQIQKVEEQGKEVYYIDTDSIVTDAELETGKELGQLSEEIPEVQEAIFLLPKMYAIRTKEHDYIKCKGFPRDQFDYKVFKSALELANMDEFHYKTEKFASPIESMRRNKKFVSMIGLKRTVISKYDKRLFIDGNNTEPVTICE